MITGILILPLLAPNTSHGFIDLSDLSSLSVELDETICNPLITTVGLLTDHRPYEPATGLGSGLGWDVGVELTLTKLPASYDEAMEAMGSEGTSSEMPAVPVPRLHLRRALGEYGGIGGSFIKYQGYSIYGGDIKLAFIRPPEGLTWAFRGSYTYTNLSLVTTHTITPQILISKALTFADPYLGIGYQYMWGTVQAEVVLDEALGITANITGKGRGRSALGFVGVQFRIPYIGIHMTLEMAYNYKRSHTIGSKVGISF